MSIFESLRGWKMKENQVVELIRSLLLRWKVRTWWAWEIWVPKQVGKTFKILHLVGKIFENLGLKIGKKIGKSLNIWDLIGKRMIKHLECCRVPYVHKAMWLEYIDILVHECGRGVLFVISDHTSVIFWWLLKAHFQVDIWKPPKTSCPMAGEV